MILDNEAADRAQLVGREIRGFREGYMLEPELRERAVSADVNMSGFVAFVTEEEEPVRTHAKNCRHSESTILLGVASGESHTAQTAV